MNESYVGKIAGELKVAATQVAATAALLAEGATVPFIARYRKEATGSLDEVAITAIRDRMAQLAELDDRRAAIVQSLQERELLTDELASAIAGAETMTALEDVYAPYRPKRRTRATIAKEAGLEPLADLIFGDQAAVNPASQAAAFVSLEKNVPDVEAALSGARDIMAERFSDDADARASLRQLLLGAGRGEVVGRGGQGRGGREVQGLLRLDRARRLDPEPPHAGDPARRGGGHPSRPHRASRGECDRAARAAVRQGAEHAGWRPGSPGRPRRLQAPAGSAIEGEIRHESKKKADVEAIRVFADNLRQLLLAPPLGQKTVLALDPGFRTGCKVAVLDPQGKLLHHDVVYATAASPEQIKRAGDTVLALAARFESGGDCHRQRHREPRDGAVRALARPPAVDHRGRRQRKRRLDLLGQRRGARGVPRPGRHRARGGEHRPPADGPALGARQDRSEVDRRGAVPARRRSAVAQERPGRRRRVVRERRGRGAEHGQQGAAQLRVGPRAVAGREDRLVPQRERRLPVAQGTAAGAPARAEGVRAVRGLPADPRRRPPARRQRRAPGELRRRRAHGGRSRVPGAAT